MEKQAYFVSLFLIVTDRDDLDGQIYKTFLRSGFMGAEEKVQPASGLNLREELTGNKAILFTLIHKFRYEKGQEYPILSQRSDIIVFVDEAHRTQYKELAENMRKGLPNAQYLAFTGTPLLGSKNLTASWFANTAPGGAPEDGYVSVYNFAESVADGATVPLFYVQRVPEVLLNNKFLNEDFCEILEDEDLSEAEQKRLENSYSQELEVIKRDDVLEVVAQNIAYHFPRRGFRGKGMVIAVDKFTAVKLYDKVQYHWKEGIKRLNGEIAKEEDEAEKLRLKAVVDYMRKVEMAVVISEGADEAEKFSGAGLQIAMHRERMNKVDENGADVEDNFKDADHPLSLVFVCAMWLTGFDAPSVSTLYLHKPMRGHTLMQTIARANRVFPGKENGIIVDYLDVFKYLKRALADYATNEDGTMPVKEIEKLLAQLQEAIEMTFAFCHRQGFDLSAVIAETETFKNLELFADYANIIVGNDEVCNEFRVLTNTVANLYESLRPDIFKMDFDPKPKEAVLYLRDVVDGKIRPEKLAQARERISTLLDQSVAVAETTV